MACPRCGLLCQQGCACKPDPWNAGYHPTCWSYIDVAPCCSVQHVETQFLPGEVVPTPANGAPAPASGQPALNEPLPQPAGEAQGWLPNGERRWAQGANAHLGQMWNNVRPGVFR